MKKSRILFLLIWIILSFVYIMDGSYEMGFVLAFYLVLHALNGVLCLLSGRELEVKIILPYSVDKNVVGCGTVKVKNASMWPVWKGNIKMCYENTLTGEQGELYLPFGVLSKGNTKAQFDIQSRYCGECKFWVEKIQVFDMFGVFSGKREAANKNSMLIFPKSEEVEIKISERDAYDMESFRYSEAIKGDDPSETFAIREYMSGDSMRKIHWKLTGKLDQIMVKESSFPIFNSLMIMLETGYENEAQPEPERMDAAVEVFLSIADMLVRRETPFELGYYDYGKEIFCSERVETTEELWNLVPGILKAGRKQAANSAFYQYLLHAGDKRFAHYMYVAADGSFSDVELAAESESITILRCGDHPMQDGGQIVFTTGNWKEELL